MRAACIAFVAGAWWLQQQPQLPGRSAVVVAAVVAGAVASLASFWRRRAQRATRRVDDDLEDGSGSPSRAPQPDSRRPLGAHTPRVAPGFAGDGIVGIVDSIVGIGIRIVVPIASAGALFVIGFAWASWCADARLADRLPSALEGRDVVVVGTVAALPDVDARGVRFAFTVESVATLDAQGRPLAVPSHLSLGWYRPGRGDGALPDVQPGQRWRLTVRLKRPHGSANPNGFDYEYWLLENGIRATGSVRPGSDDDGGDEDPVPQAATRRLAAFVWTPGHVVERVRAWLRARVLAALAEDRPPGHPAPYAGVLVALIVGDQRAIAQSDWNVFNRTGIGHLVSISGLHVSMLAALGAWIASTLWRRHPAWCGRLPAHRAAALAGTLVALVYCLLAGFGVPAQRTLYMIGIVAAALWMHRLSSASRVLCIALAIVVALDPWAVMGSGFWLSFTAVGAIFYVTSGRLRTVSSPTRFAGALHAVRTAARVQWAVTLALTPLTLLFFYQVSLVSPLANAVAIPLVSFVVTPLALAGAVLPSLVGTTVLQAAHGLVALLAAWLQWLSVAPVAVWTGAAPGPVAFVCATIGAAWWLAPRGLPLRWTGALWMVPLFAWPPDRPDAGDVRFTALDIGQGTAVLVETRASTLLYDTGPSYGPVNGPGNDAGNDAGTRIIVPFLRARGIDRLDTLVVSHNDNDHSGGALSVLQAVAVADVRSSLAPETPIVRAAPRHLRCFAGQSWQAGGVRFDVLSPPPEIYAERDAGRDAKPNARSCVLRVAAHGRVVLLTADVEKPQEAALVERRRDAIASDVLMVPHHGSRTSSTDAFLDAVHPSLAIVQAGYLNRFGHPRPDVMARYAARGIPVLRNDRDGAITVTVRADRIDIDRYRDNRRRYWYEG